jgi:hypothetical protein
MKKLFLLLFFLLHLQKALPQQAKLEYDKNVMCIGESLRIKNIEDNPKCCYSWKSIPADLEVSDLKTSEITVKPERTTTYILTVVGPDFTSKKTDQVTINVIKNGDFLASNVTLLPVAPSPDALSLLSNDTYGVTYPEEVIIEISACSDGENWSAVVTGIQGNYSLQVRLKPGVKEVTGPNGNSTQSNYCDQVKDLIGLAIDADNWYRIAAVQAHEEVHLSRFKPALKEVENKIETLIEGISVKDIGQTQTQATEQILELPAFINASTQSKALWFSTVIERVKYDHFTKSGGIGPAYEAEQRVTLGLIIEICDYAKKQNWPKCTYCINQ